ncbi:MAG: twin transmembrane helix small protein [Gammaproteobacteria bacterium]|jgi:heme/copper-type cytochrome/quinol oxidase subunit 4|nr:twin transmembrane helix small protein [Gammaproteobacteria bacterium]NCW09779.1 twin transmembrane helix small protein [Gammaproteobacteria bacterium]NCW73832.1 twin transmembrane helix small protein [Gammaproteobacteria bacterium]NCX48818.1 twin transmembrane helix small protein [Gammaproteobacteria bacterium]
MFKLLIVILFFAVVGVLFSGLYFLMKDRSSEKRVVRALAWRVGLAAALIALVAIGIATGLLEPHGVGG